MRVVKPAESTDAIAIIGMSGLFPQSKDLETFWKHLANSDDLVTEIPKMRWDWHRYYGDPIQRSVKNQFKVGRLH